MAEAVLDGLRHAPDADSLVQRAEARDLAPGWIPRKTAGLWREPATAFRAAHWRWAEAKAAMDGAQRLVSTQFAERRNFGMRNPIEGNDAATLRTLVCAYQTILPGETARSHRHAPHAFRVILESRGAWSCVDGEKHPMETGDIVLTPGWCWHGHGHDGDAPAYWFDGLDVPLVHQLEPMFFEEHPAVYEPIRRVTPDSPFRFTAAGQQRALDAASDDPAGHFGRRIAIDTASMPTIGIHVQRWQPGFESRPYRCAANQAFVVVSGRGRSEIGGAHFAWGAGDTFVAPMWQSIRHRADDESLVVSMSDEPVMRFCKFWRFEPLA
ncbi:MAG: cupin domain-containing protein [Rhodospirillaceae bacterium]|nr:cupin domain-containing protein [Rhodospirillaceae bacterium]